IYGLGQNQIALGAATVTNNTNLASAPGLDTSSPWQASSNSGATSPTPMASNAVSDLASTDKTLVLNLSEDALSNDIRNEAGDDTENEATLCHAVVSVAAGALAFCRSPARRFSRSR